MPRISKAGLGRRILVALRDPAKTPKAQLRKAARIARLTGASIELFHAIGATPAPGPDPVAVHANRALKRLERQRCFSGLKVKSHMVWDYPAHEAVVRRVLETRSDFVIAASATHGLGQRLLLTNNDWELIRAAAAREVDTRLCAAQCDCGPRPVSRAREARRTRPPAA
jgi:hypothetical protein